MSAIKSYYVIAMESEEHDDALVYYSGYLNAFTDEVESASWYKEKEIADRTINRIKDEWDCELDVYNIVIKTIKDIGVYAI